MLDRTIRVQGRGVAETTFRGVRYRAEVHTKAETGPKAKEMAGPMIKKITEVVAGWSERGKLEVERLRTSFEVSMAQRYRDNRLEFEGYTAVYKIEFEGGAVEAATGVHDALTSIEGVQAPTPEFQMETKGVYQKAFEAAVRDARDKFSSQATVLGLDLMKYEILTWTVEEADAPRGKTLGLSNGSEARTFALEPGKAVLELVVLLFFVKKGS